MRKIRLPSYSLIHYEVEGIADIDVLRDFYLRLIMKYNSFRRDITSWFVRMSDEKLKNIGLQKMTFTDGQYTGIRTINHISGEYSHLILSKCIHERRMIYWFASDGED